MRTHVFLTPSAPGVPGELVEVRFNDAEPPQFAEPVNPWARNDAELAKLRTAVADARTALSHAVSRKAGAAEVTRMEKALTSAQRELATVEFELRLKRQREQIGAVSPFARQTVGEAVAAAVAGVAALPTRQAKHTMTWDTLLRELDAKLGTLPRLGGEATAPAAASPPLGASVCCAGQYQCTRCRAA